MPGGGGAGTEQTQREASEQRVREQGGSVAGAMQPERAEAGEGEAQPTALNDRGEVAAAVTAESVGAASGSESAAASSAVRT
eukprot:8791357-Alexandrium_andersonii.AAC.1